MRFLQAAAMVIALAATSGVTNAQTQEGVSKTTAEPIKTLFIGNSYTYYNRMPTIVAALAEASIRPTRPIQVRDATLGGATLERLWSFRQTRVVLADQKWDYVVLQEQSERPLDDPNRMLSAGIDFRDAILKAGAKVVLFATWARKGKPETQQALDRAYATLATKLDGAAIAPVGLAWSIARRIDPQIALYASDGSHPSATGSYIAACVIFLTLQHDSDECSPLDGLGIRPESASLATSAAREAIATFSSSVVK